MKKFIVLLIAGLISAVVHILFEISVSVFAGPFSKIYPFLYDITNQTIWSYLLVFIAQGLLLSLAFYFIEPAYNNMKILRKGFTFGFTLWILAVVMPVLPLTFLYKIGYDVYTLIGAVISGFVLTQLMGITFISSYYALYKIRKQ